MAQEIINIGEYDNDPISDDIREAFRKSKVNFNELYNAATVLRNFSLEFTQINPNVYINYTVKVLIDELKLIRGIVSVTEYQLIFPASLGALRTTLTAINTDINALTTEQIAAGYSVRIKVLINPGESVGLAILKSHSI